MEEELNSFHNYQKLQDMQLLVTGKEYKEEEEEY